MITFWNSILRKNLVQMQKYLKVQNVEKQCLYSGYKTQKIGKTSGGEGFVVLIWSVEIIFSKKYLFNKGRYGVWNMANRMQKQHLNMGERFHKGKAEGLRLNKGHGFLWRSLPEASSSLVGLCCNSGKLPLVFFHYRGPVENTTTKAVK